MEAAKDNVLVRDADKEFEFRIGMTFANEEEAYNTYNAYAIGKGFGVRRGQKANNSKGILRTCTFLCNCEGYSPPILPHERRDVYRTVKRTGCKACIKFKIKDGVWTVTKFEEVHNHPFIGDEQKHLLRSYRHITNTNGSILTSLTGAGTRATKAYSYLSGEVGGHENVALMHRDCQNCIRSKRRDLISAGDCQSLIDHFNCLQSNGSNFSYTFQLDKEQRLTNFFWSDGVSKLDYETFGDVVVFDTTYRTSKYNMICAPFVGLNHHLKTVLFGCAFLLDETISSFEWAFQSFVKAMGNKAPKTIFTDQDHAMANAVKTVLPNTDHRLCVWHIGKNAAHHIAHLLGKPSFHDKYWHRLLYQCESEFEMENNWKAMCHEWNLEDNKWLADMYRLRHKWCPAFGRDTFSAGIGSTQESESTNNVFQDMACKTMTLSELVSHYEKQAEKLRDYEVVDDFECAREKPQIVVENSGILKHAAHVYTHAIYRNFQTEFLHALSEHVLRSETDGPLHAYMLGTESSDRKHTVHFRPSDSTITCSCKLFEMQGWLCRHTLCILTHVVNVTSIPSQYILKRWTKATKQSSHYDDVGESSHDAINSKTLRLKRLMQLAFSVMNIGANHDATEKLATTTLLHLHSRITNQMQSLIGKDDVNFMMENDESECAENCGIQIPKGAPTTRLKGAGEKRKRKESSCTGGTSHQMKTTAGVNGVL
ncbi:protein FAR1-RELATED SEQUENCE 5-like isoform X2 [Rhodamnia argentea]|uniref:Protein FAR1-RELATED SEQUENCE 5-like isoform X2 n=1 Tax=Rhodamnia argentea TaxID=178133 RepID=A0ABM3HL29_9MYRT|nr:protein FAR1-RELATED SEQUENCE 5-like isoform X2 [Rhodamnia argentea]